MVRRTKRPELTHKDDELPRQPRFIEDKVRGIVTVLLSDAESVRSEVSPRDDRVRNFYSADGELVRLELDDRPMTGTGPYPKRKPRLDEMFMTLRHAAELLGVQPSTMRRMAARGTLQTERFGKEWLTTPAWLEDYRAKRRGPGRPRRSA